MHVAVCDDNIADRKQMERLLHRESDRIASTSGILYIESYGNPEALLAAQLHYGVYYLDLSAHQMSSLELVAALRENGIDSTIFLCTSKQGDLTQLPPHVFYLEKPVKVADLKASIQVALEEQTHITPRIEFREFEKTHYVEMQEIVYVASNKKDHSDLHLTDSRTIHITESVFNIFQNLNPAHPELCAISEKILVNARHLSKVTWNKITFDTGETIKISISASRYAKSAKEHFNP